MKSVGFFNNKGGVGKTTLLCNLAASLSIRYKKEILIIDADPQCNASAYLLPEDELNSILLEDRNNSLDSFFNSVRVGNGYAKDIPEIIKSKRFNVDLIVGNPELSLREDLLATDWNSTTNGEPRGFQTTFIFKELLSRLTEYDYVLIDMGPSLGALNRAILLGVDYFLMPLSIDIFSLMAIENIKKSFQSWKDDLESSIEKHHKKENKNFQIDNEDISWKLKFAGYVSQQYRAKIKDGERKPVKAYEIILDRQNKELNNLISFFNISNNENLNLGVIPTLSSVIPLSQQAHAPVFELSNSDGIIGSHYTRVSEAGEYFHEIAKKFIDQVK